MNSFHLNAIYLSNRWKAVFILIIIVIDGIAANPPKSKNNNRNRRPGNNSSSSKWLTDDNQYNLASFEQCFGTQVDSHPLPTPLWSNNTKNPLIFATEWDYEDFIAIVEPIFKRMLRETQYAGVKNFADFYNGFKKSQMKNLRKFYKLYDVPVNRHDHNCVTLSMEIIYRLSLKLSELNDKMYLVSCKMEIQNIDNYISNFKSASNNVTCNMNMEHVLAALRIQVAGRDGIMLFDSSDNIIHAITVMKDGKSPHTGWFIKMPQTIIKREYCYTYNKLNDGFIEWTKRIAMHETKHALIYVKTPYCTAIDVSIRQNLVNDFQTIYARDENGRVPACMFFHVTKNGTESELTFYYNLQVGLYWESVRNTIKFSIFQDVEMIDNDMVKHLEQFAAQVRLTKEKFYDLMKTLYEIVTNNSFIEQILSIKEIISQNLTYK